jgi:hypothetical protein
MANCLRYLNIIIIILLFTLNIALLTISILSLFYLDCIEDENPPKNHISIIFFICTIVISTLGCTISPYCSIKLIYFKMLTFIGWFFTCTIILLASTIGMIILDLMIRTVSKNKEIEILTDLKIIILIVLIILSILYIAKATLVIRYLKQIATEVESSPLNNISGDDLTSELYKNIIRQSKEPSNDSLKQEYLRLSFGSKKV